MEQPHVRVGTPDDIDEMMKVALEATTENGFVAPNQGKLLNDIWAALNRHEGIVGIIGAPGAPIEGTILLRIGTLWYSDVRCVEEKCLFVREGFRDMQSGRARKLAEFAKAVSDELEMPLMIGVLSNHRTKAKVKMYERLFGEPAGAFFLHNARTGAA